MNLANQRVVVMGLGRFGGGVGVTRFLASRGAEVLVTDKDPEESLRASVAQLAGLPNVRFRLGEHREDDFASAGLVVVNPAVPPANPFVKAATDAGVPLTSEIRLLVQHLPNRLRTIGITGSAGKSTTTAMIGHALGRAVGDDRVHIGGNLGGSLLGGLDRIRPDDWVVLELSSFMLEGLREDRWSPHVAVITNFSANHLDWHGTLDAYRHAKQAILDFQSESDGDVAVGGPGIHNTFENRVSRFMSFDPETWRVNPPIELVIPGEHNQLNARIASTVIEQAIGQPEWETWRALGDFPGLMHRLQFVAEHGGVRYFNDSKATTPEAAELALHSFPPGVVHVFLGGYDKKSDLSGLARLARQHARAIYTLGVTGDAIAAAAESGSGDAEVVRCGTLDRAMEETVPRVRRDDVVLLSPACASWDQYENFEARGAAFVAAVLRCTGEGSPSPKAAGGL